MAKSKAQKPVKSKAPVEDKKMLVQVRIPEEEHSLLSALCRLRAQTIANRLHMIIKAEIEECYPVSVVSFKGKSVQTRVIVEKHSIPVGEFWSVIMAPEDATGIFPEALSGVSAKALERSISVIFPHLAPHKFGIESIYQDMSETWHLQLRKIQMV